MENRSVLLKNFLNEEVTLLGGRSDSTVDSEAGTIGRVVASAALVYFTGGSWLAVAAAAAGTYLSSRQQKPQDQNIDQGFANETGFGSVGQQMVQPGLVFPVAHGNRFVNPNGGCRVRGNMIHNNIDTFQGQQKRRSLFVISVGVIGNVDLDQTLIGEQPQENYFDDEITSRFRPGTLNQTTIPEFEYYSQVVKPQGFNKIELDYEANIKTATLAEDNSDDLTNVENNTPGEICTVGQPNGFGNSGVFGSLPVEPTNGGSMGFNSSTDPAAEYSVGLSAIDSDLSNSAQFSFYFPGNGTVEVWENGTQVFGPVPHVPGINYQITVSQFTPAVPPTIIPPDPGSPAIPSVVEYFCGNTLLYTSANSPTAPLFLDAAFASGDMCISGANINGTLFQVVPTYSYQVQFNDQGNEDVFDRISPNHYYATCPPPSDPNPAWLGPYVEVEDPITGEVVDYLDNTGASTGIDDEDDLPPQFVCLVGNGSNSQFGFFTVETKDPTSEIFTVSEVPGLDGKPLQLADDDFVLRWDFARYETTKNVSELWLQFMWNLHARDKEDGDPRTHGIIYDILIRRVDVPLGNESHLIRCFTRSRSRGKIFTSIKIKNLELGRYYIEVRPVFCDCDIANGPDIHEIGEFGIRREFVSPYDAGRGSVVVESEFAAAPISGQGFQDTSRSLIGWGEYDKVDVSSETGEVGQLVFVDEVVQPDVMGITAQDINYPGRALLAYIFDVEANESLSILITQGIITPNYMATGEAADQATSAFLNDPNANFVGDGISVGWVVKNIRTGQTAQINAVDPGGTSLDLNGPIDWEYCDRYVIYFEASACYYPDVLIWFLTNKEVGVGQYFPFVEWFIDWDSIVEARKFCVANNYFYDMAISKEITFARWAEDHAMASRLYIGQIGGKIVLRIEEAKVPKYVFNSSNSKDLRLTFVDQQQQKPNEMIVTYRDGSDTFEHDGRARFRPESVVIRTAAAQNLLEEKVEKRIKLNSVTNLEQAIDVGCIAILKEREQTKTVAFTTSYKGHDLTFGDWIVVQLKHLEKAEELSGFVVEIVEPFDGDSMCVKLDNCGYLFTGCVTTSTPGEFFVEADHVLEINSGDVIVTEDETQLTVTNFTPVPGGYTISFLPAIDLNEEYIDLFRINMPGIEAAAMNYSYVANEPRIQQNLTIEGTFVDGSYCLKVSGLTESLECGSPIVAGYPEEYDRVFRVTETSPALNGDVKISGIAISESLYSKDGLFAITNDDSTVTEL